MSDASVALAIALILAGLSLLGAVRGREEEMTDIGWILTIVVLVASFCIFEEWMEGRR